MIRPRINSRGPMIVSLVRPAFRRLGQFCRDRRAAVSIVAALSLPALIAFGSLVTEYGHGLLIKTEDQRVADLAAYAGALAYNSAATTDAMTSAADAAAALNGVSASNVKASLVSSPTNDGSQAVQVTISSNLTLYMAQVIGGGTSLPVSATAFAELKAEAGGCIIALSSGGAGVSLSGGTRVTASGCTVASNASETVPCGTYITAKAVTYGTTAPDIGCSGGIAAPSGSTLSIAKRSVTDPLANNTGVLSATAHLATVSGLKAPAAPSVTSTLNLDFGANKTYSQTEANLKTAGCSTPSGSPSGSSWTVICPSGGTYTFGTLTVEGGATVSFATGNSGSTYNFSGLVYNGGSSAVFGPGVYNMAQGLITKGGSTTTFGAGSFNIGPIPSGSKSSCNGAIYSICNNGTLLSLAGPENTSGGPSTFNISAGVYNSGGLTLTLGSGSTNSFDIGPSSNGDAVTVEGGSVTTFADSTGPASLFQVVGNLDLNAGGGSCTSIGAAAQHDIYGNLTTAGGLVLGSGVYSITGYFSAGGNSGGGDVTIANSACSGGVGVSGSGVSLVLGGSSLGSCSGYSGQAFCVAAGFGDVVLTAPTSGTTQGLVVIGPTSPSSSGGAYFGEGASNNALSGAFYFPQGSITLSGAANVGGGAGQCLELIGTQVSLSGGSAVASDCVLSGGSSTVSTVVLVQ